MNQSLSRSASGSKKVVIFDWDGTLVDSEAHIVKSMQAAASDRGVPILEKSEIRRIIGLGMKEAILALYPDMETDEVEAFRLAYADAFFSEGTVPSDLFPKVIDTLEDLKRQGFPLAVATGKSRNGLEKALDSTGLRNYFELTKCADETLSKPNPLMLKEITEHFGIEPNAMVMVGDTEYDLAMARNIGMPSIGVSYGVHEVALLEQHKPISVVDCISEIIELI